MSWKCIGCEYAKIENGAARCIHPQAKTFTLFHGKTHPVSCPLKTFHADAVQNWLPEATANRKRSQHEADMDRLVKITEAQSIASDDMDEAREGALCAFMNGSIGWLAAKLGTLLAPLIQSHVLDYGILSAWFSIGIIACKIAQVICIIYVIINGTRGISHIYKLQRIINAADDDMLGIMASSGISWEALQKEQSIRDDCFQNRMCLNAEPNSFAPKIVHNAKRQGRRDKSPVIVPAPKEELFRVQAAYAKQHE